MWLFFFNASLRDTFTFKNLFTSKIGCLLWQNSFRAWSRHCSLKPDDTLAPPVTVLLCSFITRREVSFGARLDDNAKTTAVPNAYTTPNIQIWSLLVCRHDRYQRILYSCCQTKEEFTRKYDTRTVRQQSLDGPFRFGSFRLFRDWRVRVTRRTIRSKRSYHPPDRGWIQ